MNLSIDLYNTVNDAPFRKELGKLPSKKFKLAFPRDILQESLSYLPEEDRNRITSLLDQERSYICKLGVNYDSHIELEKLGLNISSREYSTEISLNDSIDLVFYTLMGTPIEATRSIPNYLEFSRNLVGMKIEKITIGIEELMEVHPSIEKFILTSAADFSDIVPFSDENFYRQFLTHFHKILQDEIARLLNVIVVSLMSTMGNQSISLRGRKFGEFIIGKDTSEAIHVEIQTKEFSYPLLFETYSKLGYIFKSRY